MENVKDTTPVADTNDAKTGPVGYAITYIQDFGNGRQMQVAFALKCGAPAEVVNAEFDKLRKALDRQQAFITKRNTEAKLGAERKMLEALQNMMAESEAAANKTLQEMQASGNKQTTVERQSRLNALEANRAFKQAKMIEVQQHQTNIAIAEAVIEGADKEIVEG